MLTKKTVEKAARLSRLKLSEAELLDYQEQFEKILDYFKVISSVPTDGAEPLLNPTEYHGLLRKDVVIQDLDVDDLLDGASEAQGHLYKVPPAVC